MLVFIRANQVLVRLTSANLVRGRVRTDWNSPFSADVCLSGPWFLVVDPSLWRLLLDFSISPIFFVVLINPRSASSVETPTTLRKGEKGEGHSHRTWNKQRGTNKPTILMDSTRQY